MPNESLKKLLLDTQKSLTNEGILNVIYFCQTISLERRELMNAKDKELANMAKFLFPWALDILFRMSLVFCDINHKIKNDYHQLVEIIRKIARMQIKFQNSLSNHEFIFKENYIRFIEKNHIENQLFDLFRHNYFFINDKRMNKIFRKAFKINYTSFVDFALLYNFSIKINQSDKLMEKLLIYSNVLEQLSINIFETKTNLLNKLRGDIKKCTYVRTESDLNTNPIIKISNYLYCPLYFKVISSVGDILMYKLTRSNDKLYYRIGLELREKYLYKIIKDNQCFDVILNEIDFGKPKCGAPDVAISKGEKLLFLDSKSKSPPLDAINLVPDAMDKQTDILIEFIDQTYKHLIEATKINNEYNKILKPFNKDNVYGIVVLRDMNFIKIEKIFKKAFDNPKVKFTSDIDWVKKHIALFDINSIERLVFRRIDLIDFMINTENMSLNNKRLNKRVFSNYNNCSDIDIQYKDFLVFKNKKYKRLKMVFKSPNFILKTYYFITNLFL